MKLRVSRNDVVEFLRRTVMSFESWAERNKIHLEFRYNADSMDGFFDRDKLEKIVNNLMSNAMKFTPEGGVVEVSLRVAPEASRSSAFRIPPMSGSASWNPALSGIREREIQGRDNLMTKEEIPSSLTRSSE